MRGIRIVGQELAISMDSFDLDICGHHIIKVEKLGVDFGESIKPVKNVSNLRQS